MSTVQYSIASSEDTSTGRWIGKVQIISVSGEMVASLIVTRGSTGAAMEILYSNMAQTHIGSGLTEALMVAAELRFDSVFHAGSLDIAMFENCDR